VLSISGEDKFKMNYRSIDDILVNFKGKFGVTRVLRCEGNEYVAIAHDRGSGVILEDVFLYKRKDAELQLVCSYFEYNKMCIKIIEKIDHVELLGLGDVVILSLKKK
jgi:hypothetical protein